MDALYIFLTILALVMDLFIAGLFTDIARKKGENSSLVFWLCLLLAPIGYIYVIALPDMTIHKSQKTIIDLLKSQNTIYHKEQEKQQSTQITDDAASVSKSASSPSATLITSSNLTVCPRCNKALKISKEKKEAVCDACGYKVALSKEQIYNLAIKKITKASESNDKELYEEAIELLSSIPDYRCSLELIEKHKKCIDNHKNAKRQTMQGAHYWMCDKCGNKRSKTPCEHCGNE